MEIPVADLMNDGDLNDIELVLIIINVKKLSLKHSVRAIRS